MGVTLPATGTGDTTPIVATDKIGTVNYQQVKIVDGTVGGSQGAVVDSLGNLRVAVAAATALIGASVANFPANQNVTITGQPISVSGYVGASMANLPAVQGVNVASTVTVPVNGYLGASVTNLPAIQQVTLASTSITDSVRIASASIQVGASISNFPATQPVSGYLGASVANLPANQNVTVASTSVTQPVSGYLGASLAGGLIGASIANTPTVTLASSTIQVGVSVSNYPTNIGSVSNFNTGGSTIVFPDAAPTGVALGASPYQYITGASVNNVLVKNAAGTLYNVTAMNVNTSPRYLKLYDKATTPSPGTDLPRQTYVIPGASAGAGAVIPMPVGMLFGAGIGFAITGGSMSVADTTVTALGDVVVNLGYA